MWTVNLFGEALRQSYPPQGSRAEAGGWHSPEAVHAPQGSRAEAGAW